MRVCGIATLKEREVSFKQTIDSIYPQVDIIYAMLGGYDDYPQWILDRPKIRPWLGHNTYTDGGKAFFADLHDGYFFMLDDDLVVPPDYVEYMIAGIKKYNCIVTLHGKQFPSHKINSYIRDARISANCLYQSGLDMKMTIGGDGCMAFDTRQFKLSIEDFLLPNMSNIWVSLAAHKQGVRIMCLAHKKGYLKHVDHGEKTIWHTYTKHNDRLLTVLVNSIL